MKNKSIIIIAIFSIAAFLFRCTVNQVAGGSDNPDFKVIGFIVNTAGYPMPNTQVSLIPRDHNPVIDAPISDSFVDTTDALGQYVFTVQDTGAYYLLARNRSQRTSVLIVDVFVYVDTTIVRTGTLTKPGAVKVFLPDTVDPVNGYLYIPGTTIAAGLNGNTSSVVLDSVPAGIIPSIYYASVTSTVQKPIRYNILVSPQETATITMPTWSYSTRLYLNTSLTGANLPEDVTHFPVLVRLSSGNFDFTQAMTGGEDVRFTKTDNSPLPYEIEYWNAAEARAVIWVKVDTVYGNNDTQHIIMAWGKPGAASASNGAAVFGNVNECKGVWHLGEKQPGTLSKDATGHGFDGTFKGSLPNAVNGEIGICQQQKDSGDYVEMGDVLNAGTGNITITAWVKRSGTGTHFIAGKSSGDGPYPDYGYLFTFDIGGYVEFCVASAGANDNNWIATAGAFRFHSSITITDTTTWHFIAAVMNRAGNDSCKLYIDGIDRSGTMEGDITKVGNLFNSRPFRIGAEADGDYSFKGALDEVVLWFTSRPENWIKLCYMNQKKDDALVVFDFKRKSGVVRYPLITYTPIK